MFRNEGAFSEYVSEDPEYYLRMDNDLKLALSKFITDQGEQSYDHDLMEMGFNAEAQTIKELVDGYSYSDQYGDELELRASQIELSGVNSFLFIRAGEIQNPRSVQTEQFDFRYVGRITYKI
ncbi:MAG: immunity 22 family protein [Planctomycetes bacterium]|nr:immunity 22 family protein [Planctomycetota bacterium]